MTVPPRTPSRTPFGLKSGRIVAPADVDSGLSCGCVCPGCGGALVAKKGEKVTWHFAHHNVTGMTSCAESAIHAAAKQALLDVNWLVVPEKYIVVKGKTTAGEHFKVKSIAESRLVRFDFSREEVWETNIRPDVICYRGERRLLVEMFFTHQVDEVKLRKLEALRLPALEIDLSDLTWEAGFEAVRQRVLHGTAQKRWLFYPGEDEAKAALKVELDEEIRQLNLEHGRKLAAQLREQERLESNKVSKEQSRQKAADLMRQENDTYKALPFLEKERLIREALGIADSWPRHLNVATKQASPFLEPIRIWQAGVFAAFIFKKGHRQRRLQFSEVLDWVVARYGIAENRADQARAAVAQFWGYLRKCGFLEKTQYNPYDESYYMVVHNKLAPPTPFAPKAHDMRPTVRVEIPAHQALPHVEPHWLWRASWPNKDEMLENARSLLAGSPYETEFLHELKSLWPSVRPREPVGFAARLQLRGIPSEATLDLLVELALALKSTRKG